MLLISQIKQQIDQIGDWKEKLIDLTVSISEIPAPPFGEKERGIFIKKKFEEIGYKVTTDEVGNVIAGKPKDDTVVISAHLDTVFPHSTDVTVRREGDYLYGPGVCDDSRGLAVLLALAELTKEWDREDLVFVATVGEEGEGDLRGVKHLFRKEGEFRDKVSSFITIDGIDDRRVVTKGIGSYRYRIMYKGPGGHSYGSFGTVNPVYSLSELIQSIASWKVKDMTYSIGKIAGGISVNAIPESASCLLDMRSEKKSMLDQKESELKNLVSAAVDREMKERKGEVTYEIKKIGERPPGSTSTSSKLVKSVTKANNHFNIPIDYVASSTDANIPMNLGIPSISVSSVHMGGRAHSLDEYIDAGYGSLRSVQRNLLLLHNLLK